MLAPEATVGMPCHNTPVVSSAPLGCPPGPPLPPRALCGGWDAAVGVSGACSSCHRASNPTHTPQQPQCPPAVPHPLHPHRASHAPCGGA
eukprot:3933430-Rhodomonas_salina.12